MADIHPTAVVHPDVEFGEGVVIGPFSIIEAGVRLGARCRVGAHAVIHSRTSLGADCVVDTGACLGGDAQDFKCTSQDTYLEIGERNQIREFVTMHRSNHEGGKTIIGHDNLFMANVHVGHDAVIGNRTMFANLSAVGGHAQIDDGAVIGGMSAFHQRVRVGKMAMIGGMSGVTTDVPPFCLASGQVAKVRGVNIIGLRRNGIAPDARRALQTAVRELFLSHRHRGQALEELRASLPDLPEVLEFLEFAAAIRGGRNGRQLER